MNHKTMEIIVAISLALTLCLLAISAGEVDADEVTVSNESDLKSAVLNASENEASPTYITLNGDITLNDKLRVESDKFVILNLAGNKITSSDSVSGYLLANLGTLTITGNGTIDSTVGSLQIITIGNGGTLTIENGDYKGWSVLVGLEGSSTEVMEGTFVAGDGVAIQNLGTMKVHSGQFSNTSTSKSVVFCEAGDLTIYDGNISSSSASIISTTNGAEITIESGTFTASNKTTIINEGTSYINGGTFNGGYRVLMNTGTAKITGGTFNGTSQEYAIMNYNGELEVSPSDESVVNVYGSFGCLYNSGGTVTINGGTFQVRSVDGNLSAQTYYTVVTRGADSVATTTINDGTFKSYNNYCIRSGINTSETNYNNSVTINGGTFEVTDGADGITSTFIETTPGYTSTISVAGGTFITPLSEDIDISSGMMKGTDNEGNTIVGRAVNITISVNGVGSPIQIASGSCIPDESIPAEENGYSYTFEGYDTREDLLKTEFTEDSKIAIKKTLDAPTVEIEYTGSPNLDYGGSIILTAKASSEASGVTYQYKWLKDGIEISGETGETCKATVQGVYTVQVQAIDGGGLQSDYATSSNSVSVTVAAQTFTITLWVDGVQHDVLTVVIGGSVTEPDAPEREGYEFIGWMEDGALVNFPMEGINSNHILDAYYIPICAVSVVQSGDLYEGSSITVSVTMDFDSSYSDVFYYMFDEDALDPVSSQNGVFTLSQPGNYYIMVYAIDGEVPVAIGYYGPLEISYSDRPYVPPVIDDDDDYVPLPPHIVQGDTSSDDETVKIVACAAAAVVAALMAVFLILAYRRQ